MEKLNLSKEGLRRFGITMSLAFSVILLVIFLKRGYINMLVLGISVFFMTTAILLPGFLRPIYIIWMKFAFILGWINTRIILCIIFYLFFTPISIGIKIFKLDLLDRKIKKDKDSYWGKKGQAAVNPLNYERQF
jgi:hypothetical protein